MSPSEARKLAQAALDSRSLFEDLTLAAVALHGVPAGASNTALESHLAGRLSRSEQRQLAQAALSDDELFDTLAAHGAIETSLEDPAFQARVSGAAPQQRKVVSFPRRFRIAAVGAIAAGVAVLAFYVWKPAAPSRPTTSVAALSASLDPAAGKPTLLAQDLAPALSSGTAPVFRGTQPDSRAPQPEGTVVALDNLTATVNLGSLDGIAKGTQLEVFRGSSHEAIARMEATTIFRDRSRAFISSGSPIQVHDRVRATAPVYLSAVAEYMDSLAASGDTAGARKIGRDALAWVGTDGAAPSETRTILERLAPFNYKAGDLNAATQDYQALVDTFKSSPPPTTSEQDSAYNALGALLILRGSTTQAAAEFRLTHDAQGLNNAGVLAELRGEAANAQALYEAALRLLDKNPSAPARERQTIEANLARVSKGAHATP